jgi:long-chain acyl-CoA synthetase
MNEVQPTYFCCVPRVLEKVRARITGNAEEGSFVKRRLFRWALTSGRRRSRLSNTGTPMSPSLAWQFKWADRLVFQRIRQRLGGRLRFAVSAGAPLSADVGEFVHALGVQVLEFYGLTETLGGSMTTFDDCRYGTVGKPMPGFEIQLAPDGEILIRGNNFMGYFNQADMTAQVLRDGWCYTGDVGRWDEDGFLTITDRKKDLIITSGGKNISPQNLESLIKDIPLVANALVIGDRRKFLSALITLDPESLAEFAARRNLDEGSAEGLTRHPEVMAWLDREMERINGKLARYETIKKYVVLDRDFSQEEGEITPTLKLKRKVILEKHRDLIESMYEADEV